MLDSQSCLRRHSLHPKDPCYLDGAVAEQDRTSCRPKFVYADFLDRARILSGGWHAEAIPFFDVVETRPYEISLQCVRLDVVIPISNVQNPLPNQASGTLEPVCTCHTLHEKSVQYWCLLMEDALDQRGKHRSI